MATTSYDYSVSHVRASSRPNVHDTLDGAVSALEARQIDGLVVDLPTAFFVTAVQIANGTIVGQFPPLPGGEHFSLVLQKGNPLARCVDRALARQKATGRLAKMQRTWLSTKTRAPVLR